MGLALAPQCCCGGPGVMRAIAGSAWLFVNHELDTTNGLCLKRWPCWASPPAWNGCGSAKPLTLYEPTLTDNWAINASSLGYLPKTNEFVKASYNASRYYHDPTLDDRPAVAAGRIDDCKVLSPLGSYPGGNLEARTLLTVGQAFEVFDSFLGAVTSTEPNNTARIQYGVFSGADAEYIYGFFRWDTYTADFDRTAHFLAFKLPHGSTARTDLFSFTVVNPTSDSEFGTVPLTMNVQGGHCYNTRTRQDSAGHPYLRVYKDGGQVAQMTNPGGTVSADNWAVGEVAGQMIAVARTTGVNGFGGRFGWLGAVIIEDGADVVANQARLVARVPTAENPDAEVELQAYNIGYDYQRRALCILWGGIDLGLFGGEATPIYATYHTQPLTPGNILGQPGVEVYALFPAGGLPLDAAWQFVGGGYSEVGFSQSECWCHIISGRMPKPLRVEAGHIIDPPPPPPPLPNCDGLTECETHPPLSLSLRELDDFEVPATFSPFSGAYHWLLKNLEGGYLLSYTGGNYLFRIDLATPGNYATPGRLVQQFADTNPDYHLEHYVHAIEAHVVCTDGAVTFDYLNFYLQEFYDLTGATALTPGASGILWQVVNPLHSRPGRALHCETTAFTSNFSYDHPLHNVSNDGPRDFWANGIIGAIE